MIPFPAETVHNVSQGMREVSHSATFEQHIVVKAVYPSVRHYCILMYIYFTMQDILFCSGLNDHSERSGKALG
jgi:hypothetical protein